MVEFALLCIVPSRSGGTVMYYELCTAGRSTREPPTGRTSEQRQQRASSRRGSQRPELGPYWGSELG